MTDPQTVVIKERINWFTVSLAVAFVIAAFLLVRGCQQAKRSEGAYATIKEQIERLKKDSIESDKELLLLQEDTARTNEFVTDILSASEILEDSLNKSEVYTKYLANKVKVLSGKTDTIELLNNCEDLADAYLKEIDLNKAVRTSKDSVQVVMKLQIAQRDSISKHWRLRYESCMAAIDTVANALPALKPRLQVLIGGSGIYSPFVQGGGPTAGVRDKRGKIFLAGVKFTNHGNVYDGTCVMPINRKRR